MKVKFLLLSIFLIISTLIFSNSNTEKVEFVELSILGYGDTELSSGKQFALNIENFIAENPKIKVDWDIATGNEYNKKLSAALDSGAIPDIIYTWNGGSRHKPVLDAGQAVDQLQFIDQTKYEVGSLNGAGENGELFSVPTGKNAHAVIYTNNELIKSLGLEPAKTYEELVAQIETVTAERKTLIAFPGALGWPRDIFLFSPVLGRFGGTKFVNDLIDGSAIFNSDEVIQSLEFIKQIYDDGVFTSETLELDYSQALRLFNNNKALYLIDGSWRASKITVDDYSWQKFFTIPGELYPESGNGSYSAGFAITKSAAENEVKKDAAVKLLNYLSGETASKTRALYTGEVPAQIIEGSIEYKEGSEVIASYTESLSLITRTLGDYMDASITSLYSDGIRDLWLGETTSQELVLELDLKRGSGDENEENKESEDSESQP